ncbi:MAG: hypothetical protein ACRYFS_26510 [Janthinobacterium lividum]
MTEITADPTVLNALEKIRTQYPEVPFLALGQTVFWDEPVKAVWRRLLDTYLPGSTLIAGVHDTDYFAKTSAHVRDDQKFVALPHDDGQTRDLWSAAGEMSALFGSESVPTRAMFLKNAVPFDWLGKSYPGGKKALYEDKTAAWGWRGIVYTDSDSIIAHDIPILDIKDALLEQIDWGFAESLACVENPQARASALEVAAIVRGWVLEFLETCDESCRLSDLYQILLPRFYELLLGAPPADFQATASTALFQFNRQTYTLPRFNLVSLFLRRETRLIARAAYDKSVGGLGMYPLDAFGPGAIPFDLVIPGVGRGTIRVAPAALIIETAPIEIFIPVSERIETLAQLADVTEKHFGPGVVLVGKAITLANMIAAEHLVVFHETASAYTSATQAMNAHLAANSLPQTLYPIVRLTYPTWDALAAVPPTTVFRLPAHLAATFKAETITAPELAGRWREVSETCRQTLRESRALPSPRSLMSYLEDHDAQCWCEMRSEYDQELDKLKQIASHSETLRGRVEEHQEEIRVWQKERLELERRKGEDWRHSMQPLMARLPDAQREIDRQIAIRAHAFDEPIDEIRERITATRIMLSEFKRQRRLLERSPEAVAVRARIAEIVRDAQMARLNLVRNAYLTLEGLEHTQLRPSAWWLPLVDPTGGWLNAMASGTQARLEPLA